MDEMKIKLTSNITKKLVAKIISKTLSKKAGCKIDIQLNDLEVELVNGELKLCTNVEAKLDQFEFMKIISSSQRD